MAASSDANVAASVLDSGYNYKNYRIVNNIRVGSSTGGLTNTTTWTDTDAVINCDNLRTISFGIAAGGNAPNVFLNWGTKVGSGNKATGRNGIVAYFGNATTIRGNPNLYGCSLIQVPAGAGAFQIIPTTGAGDIVDCIMGHKGTGATAQIAMGSAAQAIANVFNLDIWGNISSAGGGVLSTFNCTNAERVTVGGNAFAQAVRSAQSTFSVKDILFFGTPSVADVTCNASAPVTWSLVRPSWSGNANRFNAMSALVTVGSIQEYWTFDVKVVNALGTAISGISVKLTDVLGNVAVNTTTDSTGRVAFGSGITMNTVSVRDHYGDGVSYLTRDRSPFLMEVNTVTPNSSYPTMRYYFTWPTDSSARFEDMADAIPLIFASGLATTWTEASL